MITKYPFQLDWAPGNETLKSKWTGCWNAKLGCSYIPENRLVDSTKTQLQTYQSRYLKALEEVEKGGVVDENTIPAWVKNLRAKIKAAEQSEADDKISQPTAATVTPKTPKFPPKRKDCITGTTKKGEVLF